MHNAIVSLIRQIISAWATLTLHGGIRAVSFEMLLHVTAFAHLGFACVTLDVFVDASFLVRVKMWRFERITTTSIRTLHIPVLAQSENMFSILAVRTVINFTIRVRTFKSSPVKECINNWMHRLQGSEGLTVLFASATLLISASFANKFFATVAILTFNSNIVAILA